MLFADMTAAPADPILGLTEAFRNDPRKEKVNLGVGVFVDANGVTPVLECVKRAERMLWEEEATKTYLPISGTPAFAAAVGRLVFGDAFPVPERVGTLQTPGGTGALCAAAQLLASTKPGAKIHLPAPTWGNHKAIFAAAGMPMLDYPYLHPETKVVDEEALCVALDAVPEQDVVLLHACCHNPTGADISMETWGRIAQIAGRRGWTPFFDFAYQGFGESLDADRAAILTMFAEVPEGLVASSFSKNMGLYSERVGSLNLVAANAKDAATGLSQAKRVARTLWSNPPRHGGAIVQRVLDDEELRQLWVGEVAAMQQRIARNREIIAEGLSSRLPGLDFTFLARQRGMFSFCGIAEEQVRWLKEDRAIYVVAGGRINVAGLPTDRADAVCDALAEAFRAQAG